MYGTQSQFDSKKELTRVHWPTVQKIVAVLYREGTMKKTTIARKCSVSYGRFRIHLDWCESMKLVRSEEGLESELISLTERGVELYREQFACKKIDID